MSLRNARSRRVAQDALSPSDEVRRLLEASRVDEARAFVTTRVSQGDTTMEGWARVLEPPRVRVTPGATRSDFESNLAWLRAHRAEFAGRWVGLRDGELLSAAESLRALTDELDQHGALTGSLVLRVA